MPYYGLWLAKPGPLSQQMSNITQINGELVTFSCANGAHYILFAMNSDWFIVLFMSAVIGRSNQYFGAA